MTDRAAVVESVQIGLEVTPGTAVAAPTTVRSMSVGMKIAGDDDVFRPDGHKFNAIVVPNMEWSTFSLTGKPTYTEVCYPLESIFGTAVLTNPGVLTQKRVYDYADTAVATPKTLTIMKGSSVRAQKLAYGVVTDLAFTFSRKNGLALTGQGIGQQFTDGITMTASPTDVALVPLAGKQIDVFIDSTAAGLGTTKLLRAFNIDSGVTGAYGPIWPINSANPSFGGVIDLALGTSCKLQLEADAAGMAFLTQYRSGDLIFLRVLATGPTIEVIAGTPPVTYTYLFQVDLALGVNKAPAPDGDVDGVTIVEYDCEFVRDSTWGKAMEITVQNAIASL